MDIIKQLKQDVTAATAEWHKSRTARAHGRMTAARGDLALARWLRKAGVSLPTALTANEKAAATKL